MSIINRNDGEGINWNEQNLFQETRKVRGVDNVIDIMIINLSGTCYSISPQKYIDVVATRDYNKTDRSRVFRCNDDSEEPISAPETSKDSIKKNLSGLWNRGAGQRKEGPGGWHANDDGVDDEISINSGGFKDSSLNWTAMKQADPGIRDNEGNCTEFSLLYNRLVPIQNLFLKGYKLFDMNNFNSNVNWILYYGSGGYYKYLFVMYLSAENYVRELGCFNKDRNDNDSIIRRLFNSREQGLTKPENLIKLSQEFCSSGLPDYSIWTLGDYEMGSTLYSPNTKYKFVNQPDGNQVIYELKSNSREAPSNLDAIWSSGTYLSKDGNITVRAMLSIQSDGNVVLYAKKSHKAGELRIDAAVWSTNTRGSNVKLGLSNNGILFVFDTNNSNFNIHWVSSGNAADLKKFIQNNILSFYDKCDDNTYVDNKQNVLKYITNYCTIDNNIYKDENCKKLFSGQTVANDTSNNTYKKLIDSHVQNKICADGYETKNDADLNKFCSCVNPVGDAKKIFLDYKYHPRCWQKDCIDSGYRLSTFNDISCPENVCIQTIDMKNVTIKDGAKINQDCNIVSDKSPPTTGNNQNQGNEGSKNVAAGGNENPKTDPETSNEESEKEKELVKEDIDYKNLPFQAKITNKEIILNIIKNPSLDMNTFIIILFILCAVLYATYMVLFDSGSTKRSKPKRKKRNVYEDDGYQDSNYQDDNQQFGYQPQY